jgi:hypothetical protein
LIKGGRAPAAINRRPVLAGGAGLIRVPAPLLRVIAVAVGSR